MKFSFERKANTFIISDQYQSFSISILDMAEFNQLVKSMILNFSLNKENNEEKIAEVGGGIAKSGEKVSGVKISKRKKKRRNLHKRSK